MRLFPTRLLGCPVVAVLALIATGCEPRIPCVTSAGCPVDAYCVPDSMGESFCMDRCDPALDGALCPSGAVCMPNAFGRGYCWTGGPIPIGSNCTDILDCEYGAICVGVLGAGMTDTECYEACEPDGSVECSGSQMCGATTNPRLGICIPRRL